MLVVEDSVMWSAPFLGPYVTLMSISLLGIVGQQWKVEDKRYPVSVDQEKHGQESVYRRLGHNVGIQSIAEVDRIDIVTVPRIMLAEFGLSST